MLRFTPLTITATVAVISLVAMGLSAQKPSTPVPVTPFESTTVGLFIEPFEVDLGIHEPAFEIENQPELTFLNTSDQPITIHKIEPSCTCTVPKVQLPIVVPAQSRIQQKFPISMRPKKGQLSIQSAVTFHTDAPNGTQGFIRFYLQLTRSTEPQTVPKDIVLGRYASWETQSRSFRIDPGANIQPLSVESIHCSDPRVQVKVRPDHQDKSLLGTVEITAHSDVTPIRSKVTIQTTHGPVSLSVNGTGFARCLPESDVIVCRRDTQGHYHKSTQLRLAPDTSLDDLQITTDSGEEWPVESIQKLPENSALIRFSASKSSSSEAQQCILRLGNKVQGDIAQIKCFLVP